jgi:hypothetical protein
MPAAIGSPRCPGASGPDAVARNEQGGFLLIHCTKEDSQMDKFVEEYVEHALCSNTTEDGEQLLWDEHTIDDLDDGTLGEIEQDCDGFRKGLPPELRKLVDERPEVAGPHFYMARNSQAEGFCDEDWPGVGAQLRKAAAEFGSKELFLDEEYGRIYAR